MRKKFRPRPGNYRGRLASSGLALLGVLVAGYLALFELGVSQQMFCPIVSHRGVRRS